jgi:hypothetical protein
LDFEAEWARLSPLLIPALERAGTHRLQDVRAAVEAGEAQFWRGTASVIVTELQVYPLRRVLHAWLGGGDLAEITGRMRPEIEAWAVRQGCSRVTIEGRLGWPRALRDHGYEAGSLICSKELP